MTTVKELMKPRYKVIADYPNQWHRKDHIVTDLFYDDHYKEEKWFEQYPAIFQRLEWWQERSESELPAFVKDKITSMVLRVEYNFNAHTFSDVKTRAKGVPEFWNTLYDLLPATESEYFNS